MNKHGASVHPLMVAVLLIFVLSGPAAAAGPPLFGTREVMLTNLQPFPKWTGMLAQFVAAGDHEEGRPCRGTIISRCNLESWQQFIDSVRGKAPREQVDEVNAFMNRGRYITDQDNWQTPDYWATPRQFLRVNGDCEDYAIAKFITLRSLGFSNEQLRVVVLNDMNLRVPHAILVAYVDGEALVLDNQIKSVISADRIHHYRPIYSINETAWWRHL